MVGEINEMLLEAHTRGTDKIDSGAVAVKGRIK